jgi:hypothetical protein
VASLLLAVVCALDATLIDTHGVLQAPVEGIADQSMTDRYLIYPWNTLDEVL